MTPTSAKLYTIRRSSLSHNSTKLLVNRPRLCIHLPLSNRTLNQMIHLRNAFIYTLLMHRMILMQKYLRVYTAPRQFSGDIERTPVTFEGTTSTDKHARRAGGRHNENNNNDNNQQKNPQTPQNITIIVCLIIKCIAILTHNYPNYKYLKTLFIL